MAQRTSPPRSHQPLLPWSPQWTAAACACACMVVLTLLWAGYGQAGHGGVRTLLDKTDLSLAGVAVLRPDCTSSSLAEVRHAWIDAATHVRPSSPAPHSALSWSLSPYPLSSLAVSHSTLHHVRAAMQLSVCSCNLVARHGSWHRGVHAWDAGTKGSSGHAACSAGCPARACQPAGPCTRTLRPGLAAECERPDPAPERQL